MYIYVLFFIQNELFYTYIYIFMNYYINEFMLLKQKKNKNKNKKKKNKGKKRNH